MSKLRKVLGGKVIRTLCNKMGFVISGRTGGHVRLSKVTPDGKVGTGVHMHKALKIGTQKGILKLAKGDEK